MGIALHTLPLGAQTVYKWVDANGKVSYSAAPPPDATAAQPIAIQSGPGPERRAQAEARLRRMQEESQSLEASRREAQEARQAAVDERERTLMEAKRDLAEARVQQPEDWQTIADGGGRFLTEAYFERVRAAEEVVKDAEEALARARRDLR